MSLLKYAAQVCLILLYYQYINLSGSSHDNCLQLSTAVYYLLSNYRPAHRAREPVKLLQTLAAATWGCHGQMLGRV